MANPSILKSNMHSKSLLTSLFLPLAIMVGCGDGRPPAYPTKGKVVFADGSPVKVGTIETKSLLHDAQATAAIERDGSFVLTTYKEGDGAVSGPHTCVVVQFIQAENITNHKPSTLGVVNPKHASYATSNLKIEVSPNKPNEFVVQVEGIANTKNGNAKSDHERGIGGHTDGQ